MKLFKAASADRERGERVRVHMISSKLVLLKSSTHGKERSALLVASDCRMDKSKRKTRVETFRVRKGHFARVFVMLEKRAALTS